MRQPGVSIYLTLGLPALLALLHGSARAQANQLYFVPGLNGGGELGRSVADSGDVDGDGVSDFLVGSPYAINPTGGATGSVRLISGKTGLLLYTFYDDVAGARFGHSVAGAGDVDSDGFPDIIAGAPDIITNYQGHARVYSGLSKAPLFTLLGNIGLDAFGWAVSGAGDVDGDGYDDVIVGAPGVIGSGPTLPHAQIFRGPLGTPYTTYNGVSLLDGTGSAVRGCGDLNGDGQGDVCVGAAYGYNQQFWPTGSATVYTGSGATLWKWYGGQSGDEFGCSLGAGSDADGDGVADLIVGARYGFKAASGAVGFARILSGKTGLAINTFYGDAPASEFGAAVDFAGDWNGDGKREVVIGAPFAYNAFGSATGRVIVRAASGSPQYMYQNGSFPGAELGRSVAGLGDLTCDGVPEVIAGAPFDLSLAKGSATVWAGYASNSLTSVNTCLSLSGPQNAQKFTLSAPGHGGQTYLVLGSVTGTSPGISADGLVLPLAFDAYTQLTLQNPNKLPLVSGFGILSPSGTTGFSFKLPAGLPASLAGTAVWHAALVIQTSPTLKVVFVSNAEPALIVP